MPDGTVYVSGRAHEGRDGYWVVTPLTIGAADGSGAAGRAWAGSPRPEAAPAPPTGTADLVG